MYILLELRQRDRDRLILMKCPLQGHEYGNVLLRQRRKQQKNRICSEALHSLITLHAHHGLIVPEDTMCL